VKKIARVFIVAVFVPSLVLAWLAVRSLRDQQLILERQQFLLYQSVADDLASQADDVVAGEQTEFGNQVEAMLAADSSNTLATSFDDKLRRNWTNADVGFAVSSGCILTCPSPATSTKAAAFVADFGKFLINSEVAEVYSTQTKNGGQIPNAQVEFGNVTANSANIAKGQNIRVVVPQQALQGLGNFANVDPQQSKVAASETEFRQVVGDSTDGAVARFVENKLTVLLWHRPAYQPDLIYGAELSLDRLKQRLRPIVEQLKPTLRPDIAVALLDDAAKPVAVSQTGFNTNWKRPFVATELGESLPHWEMAVYILDPAKLAQSAHVFELTLGLLTAVLLLAIAVGGWLIVADLNRQLTLARQKTDFVSNVSHELKTPLTSIRMFSELLAEGRVSEPARQQSYLNIITSEASRLTRLINNVLDFSRLERGEKKYQMQRCDFAGLLRETVQTYQPHLESNGFQIKCAWPETDIPVLGDRDALAQVIVNLLSNAEKYSAGKKEIAVELECFSEPLPFVEARVLDRGTGVPPGCEEKIFEQFFRAHDSLSSGIQGSGLGLTLARQIARAHGGDVLYRPRPGGGSCFTLRLPVAARPSTP
jgi:signal transduction histidine kinase